MPLIQFEFEGRKYCVDGSAHEKNFITLPDGRVLEVYEWSETSPPSPLELRLTGIFHEHSHAPLAIEVRRDETSSKVYIVITSQYCVGVEVIHHLPLLVTSDPRVALKGAHDLTKEKGFNLINTVYILAMEEGRKYNQKEMIMREDETHPNVVFTMWRKPGCGGETEILSLFRNEQFEKDTEGIPE